MFLKIRAKSVGEVVKLRFRCPDDEKQIVDYELNLEDVIFSRLTGSGSCIFSVFQNKTEAEKAQIQFNKDFPKLWSHLAENNKLNLF